MFEFLLQGGLLIWPIMFCSVLSVTLALHKWLQYRKVARQLSWPVHILRKDPPWIILPILEGISGRISEKEISLIGTRLVRRLERGLGALSLISVISPLLGLTGTVIGMIKAFQAIASAGSRPDPGMLATGIWEALITTAAGLMVAIAAHVIYHYLNSRMNEIALNLQEITMVLHKEGYDSV